MKNRITFQLPLPLPLPFQLPFLLLLFLWLSILLFSTPAQAQLASPVVDAPNNAVGLAQKIVMQTSQAIRKVILPLVEKVGQIQDFFQKARSSINVVIVNLQMTKQLIETEKRIERLYLRTFQRIDRADNLTEKWRYYWLVGQLYWEAQNVFIGFELLYQDNKHAYADDEGRILIIADALEKTRAIHRAMKATVRQINREIFLDNRTRRQLQTYRELFEH